MGEENPRSVARSRGARITRAHAYMSTDTHVYTFLRTRRMYRDSQKKKDIASYCPENALIRIALLHRPTPLLMDLSLMKYLGACTNLLLTVRAALCRSIVHDKAAAISSRIGRQRFSAAIVLRAGPKNLLRRGSYFFFPISMVQYSWYFFCSTPTRLLTSECTTRSC